MKSKYFKQEQEFFFLRFLLIRRATQNTILTTFPISRSAETKGNILFAASPIDQTDGNHWTTAEIEIQTQNTLEVDLLSSTALLPLECMVKHRSVCTRHVFG